MSLPQGIDDTLLSADICLKGTTMCQMVKRCLSLILLPAFLFASLAADCVSHAAAPSMTPRKAAVGWQTVPSILARIKVPTFPKRDFKITDYGAHSGDTDNTDSIRKAIDACHTSGGGRVVVPPGVFQTGAIHLKSNVNLHLSEG